MSAAPSDSGKLTMQAWSARYAHRLDHLRSALDACLAQQNHWETGAALTISSAPLWFRVSQVEAFRDRVIAEFASSRNSRARAQRQRLRLPRGARCGRPADRPPNGRGLRSVAFCGHVGPVGRAEAPGRWGICVLHAIRGEYAAAPHHSQSLFEVAQSTPHPAALNLAHRMTAWQAAPHRGACVRMAGHNKH